MRVECTTTHVLPLIKHSGWLNQKKNLSYLIPPTWLKYYIQYWHLINISTSTLINPSTYKYSSRVFFLHTFFLQYKPYGYKQFAIVGLGNRDTYIGSHKYKLPRPETQSWLLSSKKFIVNKFNTNVKFWLTTYVRLRIQKSDFKNLSKIRNFNQKRSLKLHPKSSNKGRSIPIFKKNFLFTNNLRTSQSNTILTYLNIYKSFTINRSKNSFKVPTNTLFRSKLFFTRNLKYKNTSQLLKLVMSQVCFPVTQSILIYKQKQGFNNVQKNLHIIDLRVQRPSILKPRVTIPRQDRSIRVNYASPLNLPSTLPALPVIYLQKQLSSFQFSGKITSDVKYPSIKPRFFTKFILHNVGIFLTYQNNFFLNSKNFTPKSQFKKKLFSFVYPEHEKKSLFLRKKKLTLSSLWRNTSQKLTLSKNFSFKNLKKINSYMSKKVELDTNNRFIGNYKPSYTDVLSPINHKNKGSDNRYFFTVRDIKLSRIRFKPGYQRLWRQARTALKLSLGLSFKYQKRLTRLITRYYTQVNRYLFAASEASAQNIILYSLLVPDLKSVRLFQNKRLFYINGKLLGNLSQLVTPNDLIQIIVSVWYYIIFRWLYNWTLSRIKKFKRLVYRKGLASKYQLMKTKKRTSRYTPSWIINSRYDHYDIKPYLEVDYLTLSIFVLHDPYLNFYYSPDNLPDLKLSIYRLYNWKYIT